MAASESPTTATGRIDVFWHEGMLKHNTGAGVFDTGTDPGFLDVLEKHPENADRVRNMLSILRRGPISPCISFHSGRPALISELLTFHSQGTFGPSLRRCVISPASCPFYVSITSITERVVAKMVDMEERGRLIYSSVKQEIFFIFLLNCRG